MGAQHARRRRWAPLLLGRRVDEFSATEMPLEQRRLPLPRAYLRRWKWEVGAFFGGVGPDPTDE